ncbi:MAG: FAD-binding oxidoreductase [Pseudomonadota bacterium]
MSVQSGLVQNLKAILGSAGWVDPEPGGQHTSDIFGDAPLPLLIARPSTTNEISQVVAACAKMGVSIVPQGGNSNVCRMAVPLSGQDCVVVSTERMNQILEVDPDCSTMTLEAGCTLQQAQEAAVEKNRLFAPDWGARGTAHIGGALSTNGGGLNVVRYGTTREQVMGLEVVLPDGRVWDGMRALHKDNSGYDLKHMFIGSEGTLGIITKAIVKLHPLPRESQSMFCALTDMTRLIELFNLARAIGGDRLTAFELLPGLGVEKALGRYPDLQRPLETRSDWYVLIRFAGTEPVEADLMKLFEQGFDQEILADAVMSQSLSQEQNLWELRDQMIPKQYFPEPMLKWDVSVPITRIVDFLDQAAKIVQTHQSNAIPYAVGHVGDGNIHYSVFPVAADTDNLDGLCDRIYSDIDDLIWSLGGSIVAEHGVGSVFVERMRRQKSDVEYELLQNLKRSFDPKGIMNPGKLIAD